MRHTIVSASRALRGGTLTALELVESSLTAIQAHQPETNAFITVDTDGARAAARAADLERSRGVDRGPLHGIPVSLKDLIDVAGVVTTAGSRVLADRVASKDASVVTRLREAGAIIIGRTNLHEFALGTTSEDSAFGPVHNPHDGSRSAGGSSGGSAAAVATAMGLASVGTDTGGSIRIPAAACGIVGLKPSLGDVPTDGIIPLSRTLDHVGPLALTVADAVILYNVLSARAVAPTSPRVAGDLRLRRLTGYFDQPLDPFVRVAFGKALERFHQLGVQIDEVQLDGTADIAEAYVNIVLPEAAHWHGPYLETRAGGYTPTVRSRIADGRSIAEASHAIAIETCRRLQAEVDGLLEGCDALILPTLPIVAPPLGSATLDIDGEAVPVRAAMLKHTQLFNLTGHPAMSIPVPTNGLPVGLQLVGRRGKTLEMAGVALACEQAMASEFS